MRKEDIIHFLSLSLFLLLISALRVGSRAPDFVLKNLEDETVSLKNYPGKPILLTFFNMDAFDDYRIVLDLDETYAGKLEVLAIAVGESKETFREVRYPMLQFINILLASGLDDPAVKAYEVRHLPATFLIDTEGKLKYVNLRGKEIEQKTRAYLNDLRMEALLAFAKYGPFPPLTLQSLKGYPSLPPGELWREKPAIFFFWLPLSLPSERSILELEDIASQFPQFVFFAPSFASQGLLENFLREHPLKKVFPLQFSPREVSSILENQKDEYLPLLVIVNRKGEMILRTCGTLSKEDLKLILTTALKELALK